MERVLEDRHRCEEEFEYLQHLESHGVGCPSVVQVVVMVIPYDFYGDVVFGEGFEFGGR